jgi:hypothetical protein
MPIINLKGISSDRGWKMKNVIKLFGLAAVLIIAAFFANYFGFVSIPWLEFNSVPTYSDGAIRADEAVREVFK